MNIIDTFGEVNIVVYPQSGEVSIDRIAEVVSQNIIGRLDPVPFEHSPNSFGYGKFYFCDHHSCILSL